MSPAAICRSALWSPPGRCRHCGPMRVILRRAVDRAWSVLMASNRTPWLFRAGGVPSWVVPDDEGRPMVALLTDERLRHILAKLGELAAHRPQRQHGVGPSADLADQVAVGDARSRPAGAGGHRHHAGVRPDRGVADRTGLSRRCQASLCPRSGVRGVRDPREATARK